MLFTRMLRAALFDRALYDDLRQDPVALGQAMAIIVLAILAVVIGSTISSAVNDKPRLDLVLRWLLYMPGIWLLPATSLFVLGGLARVANPARGSNRDLLIAIGFSASPGVLFLALGLPSPVGFLIGQFIMAWMIASMVLSAKAILQIGLFRAIAFVAPGILMYLLFARTAAPS